MYFKVLIPTFIYKTEIKINKQIYLYNHGYNFVPIFVYFVQIETSFLIKQHKDNSNLVFLSFFTAP